MTKHVWFEDKLLIGRSEWCQLPRLGIPAIKAKIDTGAKTSALHAFNIRLVSIKGHTYARFDIHPLQANKKLLIQCKARVVDERYIMSSNGHKEHRYIISTPLTLGNQTWNIEISLSNRDPLTFRFLLGRQALNHRVLIDPSLTCKQSDLTREHVKALYRRYRRQAKQGKMPHLQRHSYA